MGLEKLIKKTFIDEDYNKLVRPVSKLSGLTDVFTELKILQIDLVRILLSDSTADFKNVYLNLIFFKGRKISRAHLDCLDRDGKNFI